MGPPSRYAIRSTQRDEETVKPQRHTEEGTSTQSVVEWAKDHLKLLATASSVDEFNERATRFFARHVNSTVNGVHLSRALYAQQWGTGGNIQFGGAIETSHVRLPTVEASRISFCSLSNVAH